MTPFMSSYQASQSSNVPSNQQRVQDRSSVAENTPLESSSKTYHATGDWGKRGMTLQELTRAFDAFNEDEERVAIGFAGSEDFNRKLAEPLREVKTVFLDLDGLAPLSGYSSFSSSSSVTLSSSHTVSHMPQASPPINQKETHEPGYLMPPRHLTNVHSATPAQQCWEPTNNRGVNEDTIRPCLKRRRSLLTMFPLGTPRLSQFILEFDDAPEADTPVRPPSRLGFLEEENVDEHSVKED